MFHPRRGAGAKSLIVVLGSIGVVALLVWLTLSMSEHRPPAAGPNTSAPPASAKQSLLVYCAAGVSKPIEAAIKDFESEFGITIETQFEGSGTLLGKMEVTRKGDLYIAADQSYIAIAREKNLIAETLPLARQTPVIAVKAGNPKGIKSLDDLVRGDVAFGLPNPEAASIGKLTKSVTEKIGKWDALQSATKVFKPTVHDIANDVAIGAIDAAVVWDANVRQMPALEAVNIPEFDSATQEVTLAVLNSCEQPATALKFARYLQAPEKGGQKFDSAGYGSVGGDKWEETPKLTLFSGGVNRVAIQETVAQFEAREGIQINVVYNGCGILVAQMKAGEQPDAYFACDTSFMTQVQDQFSPSMNVSQTDMVIITQQGNPKGIKTLADLTQPNLKLGIAHEEQSALGALTRRLLEPIPHDDSNMYAAILPNVSVRTPTADLLVTQLRVGALDAAVVYKANVSQTGDSIVVIPITEGEPSAMQPIAVSKSSTHPYLAARLVEAISSATSKSRFETAGFRWLLGAKQP